MSNKKTRWDLKADAIKILKEDFGLGKKTSNIHNDIAQLAKHLADENLYYYSRELYNKIYKSSSPKFHLEEEDFQNIAKYIYKDTALSSEFKFNAALEWLKYSGDIFSTQQCETCGIIGAIYKRKWYYNRNLSNLDVSKLFYQRGYNFWKTYITDLKPIGEPGTTNDFGYCAINLSYVYEKLAFTEYQESAQIKLSDAVFNYLNEAVSIREYIIKFLGNEQKDDLNPEILNSTKMGDTSFCYATLIEALLGINDYDKARVLCEKYLTLDIPNWKKQSLTEQLCHNFTERDQFANLKSDAVKKHWLKTLFDLPILASFDKAAYKDCIRILMEKKPGEELPSLTGKMGLALSGGGYRASYFHIGVIAALAENNKLKDIEVLSCVSGGSIIGAYYYLQLKKLYEEKMDAEITLDDYKKIICEMIRDFHKGVKKNLRMRIFSSIVSNFKMTFFDSYTRSNRTAELYDELLYNALDTRTEKKGPISMTDIKVYPKGEDKFNPRTNNFNRVNKVPQLILNTTNINSGHNFQFTASWMGEPPHSINKAVDSKARFRRMYYEDAKEERYQKLPLSVAVGVSSCVPAMFPAVEFKDLYNETGERKVLKLVDGGVCDNQGLSAILEQECKILFLSDASGQMGSNEFRDRNTFGESYRSSSIASERIREMQLSHAIAQSNNEFFDSFHLLHLRKGINEKNISWVGNNEAESKIFGTTDNETTTSYGMDKELQTALSEIRTDLDAFSDNEAHALMFSGYVQTINSLADTQETVADDTDWAFKKVEKQFTESFIAEMKIGKIMFGKWWYILKLKKAWLYYTIIALVIALFGVGFIIFLDSVKDVSGTALIAWFKDFRFDDLNLYYVKWVLLAGLVDIGINKILKGKFRKIRLLKLGITIPSMIVLWVVFNAYKLGINKTFLGYNNSQETNCDGETKTEKLD